MSVRPFALVTLVALGLAAGLPSAARAEDPAPGAQAAPTIEQVLKDLADKEFTVKRLDAATAAKDFQDPRLVPLLAKLLKDDAPEVRAAAVAALANRTDGDQQKKASEALTDRVKAMGGKVEVEQERITVVKALGKLAQPGCIDALLDDIEDGMSPTETEARCMAVANVPSPKAIEGLIGLMSKRHRDGTGIRASAVRALQYATGEKGGNDPDQWRAWWKDHEKTFDFAAAAERRAKAEQAKEERDARRDGKKDRGGKKKDGDGKDGKE